MAILSKVVTPGVLGVTDYTFNLGYIAQAHIIVTVDGVLQVDPTDYSWINNSEIRFVVAMVGGENIVMQRASSQAIRLVTYFNASTLSDENLNKDSLQAYYLSQEAIDLFGLALGLDNIDNQLTARLLRVKNVGAPTADADAVRKQDLDAVVAAAGNVPIPSNPGDDGKQLTASAGLFAWTLHVITISLITDAVAFMKTFLASATVALARTNLGLGTMSTEAVVAISGHLSGLNLANGSDADHDIDVAAGIAVDSTNTAVMQLASAMTKQLDATWAAGTNQGGLFTGTITTATWYHLFLIQKDSDSSIDVGFDTSVIAANIPTGYTEYRRIGSVLTDSSSNIFPGFWDGDSFLWLVPPLDVNSSAVGTTAALATMTSPLDVRTEIMANVLVDGATRHSVYISSPDVTDLAPSTTIGPLSTISMATATNFEIQQISVRTDLLSQVRYRASLASTTLRIVTLGWIDKRGKD